MRLINGRAFKPSDWTPQGLPIVRIQNLNNEEAPFNYFDKEVAPKFLLDDGDFLISWSGTPGTSFGAHIWQRGRAILNQHIFRAELHSKIFEKKFLKLAINSRLIELIEQAHGGVGLQHITKPKLESLPLTVPPLDEQIRIIAKCDELMALCDQLEAAQQEREARRDRLVTASLKALVEPSQESAGESVGKTSRKSAPPSTEALFLQQISRLTTQPKHVQQLRLAVLDLSVKGRLGVPAMLLAENNFDRTERFATPSNWRWEKVKDVAETRLGKMLDKAKNKGEPKRYLRNVNVRWYGFDLSDLYEMRFEVSELKEFSLKRGDVLVCEGGEPGRAAIWDERDSDLYFQKAIHRVRLHPNIDPKWLVNNLYLDAQTKRLDKYFTGVGIKHLTGKGLGEYLFPVPPLDEQRRIISKADQLLALCDKLEAHITSGQETSRKLLEALLHEALEGEWVSPQISR